MHFYLPSSKCWAYQYYTHTLHCDWIHHCSCCNKCVHSPTLLETKDKTRYKRSNSSLKVMMYAMCDEWTFASMTVLFHRSLCNQSEKVNLTVVTPCTKLCVLFAHSIYHYAEYPERMEILHLIRCVNTSGQTYQLLLNHTFVITTRVIYYSAFTLSWQLEKHE